MAVGKLLVHMAVFAVIYVFFYLYAHHQFEFIMTESWLMFSTFKIDFLLSTAMVGRVFSTVL